MTSSNSLGDRFSVNTDYLPYLLRCEKKGWNRGRWVGIYTQIAWLCLGLVVKSVSRVISLTLSANGPRKLPSYLLHAVLSAIY